MSTFKALRLLSMSANSFAELYDQHPDAIDDILFAELDRIGFVVPPSRKQSGVAK